MKNIKSVLGVAALAAVLGTTLASSNVLAWGDSDGGRSTYTVKDIQDGKSGDKIFFDSISDGVDGNELYFVSARSEEMKTWNTDELQVEDGKTYLVRLYVHNNNPYGTDGVAKDVKVTYTVPTTSGKEVKISGFIDSSNATPKSYWDSVVFKANQNFHLEYVAGSATIANNGKLNGTKLSDNIVKNGGTLIGYDTLNGEIPGCFQYSAYIGIQVKVVYDYDFEISKTVRNVTNGDKTWAKQVYAKEGDTVEYQIYYKNTSNVSEKNVQILDKLGSNQTYVKGSTKLYNVVNPKGLTITSDEITGKGINIGDYAAGAEAYIRFRVTVKNNNLGCGADNVLRSWAQGYIGSNKTMKQDYADVLVRLACPETPETPETPEKPPVTPEEPVKIPETGPVSLAGLALGAGSLTTAAGAYIASRKRF